MNGDWMAWTTRAAGGLGRGIARGAKATGRGVRGLLAKVNPDIYREFGFVALSGYSLLLPRRERVADPGPDGFLPVVLVHGLGGNRGTMTPLRLYLRLVGHRRVFSFGYEDGTVEEIAARLVAFVGEVQEATGCRRVDIAAHSLGGIVARHAVQRLGLARDARTLVTIATPHGGTYTACYANTVLTRALRPDSPLLADLNGEDFARLPTRLVAIWSDRDIYVVPAERMTHPAAENVLVPGLSHTQHLVAPAVFRAVAARLDPAPEAAPRALLAERA